MPFTEWSHVPEACDRDPLAGASIADVRAFAIDPDVEFADRRGAEPGELGRPRSN